jgi:hypothetical protein
MSFPKQSRSSCSRYGIVVVLCLATVAGSLQAQLGTTWEEYRPDCDLHLGNQAAEKRQRCLDADSSLGEALGSPSTAAYASDAGQKKERFTLHAPGERARVREKNDYRTGSHQFEGWVTVRAPIERQMIFQIRGSGEQDRATQFFLRGYHEDGGTLRAFVAGSPSIRVAKSCYDREIRATVIHLQDDEGGRILLYLDGKRVRDVPDVFPRIHNNAKGNYHKYGCYGSFEAEHRTAGAEWRNVHHFQGGHAPKN